MRHCSVSACETFVPGPMIASAPPICPKSALSRLPLIRPPTTFPTTRIRDEKLDAFGVPGHHPRLGGGRGILARRGQLRLQSLDGSLEGLQLRSEGIQSRLQPLTIRTRGCGFGSHGDLFYTPPDQQLNPMNRYAGTVADADRAGRGRK